MKVFIRCDSSTIIGTGHVMRCLTLAHDLKSSGIDITFVCRLLEGNIIDFIEEKQFKVKKLSAPQNDLGEENTLNLEQLEMETLIRLEKPKWVIVDHYNLSKNWENAIHKLGVKIFAIDDIERHHDCDVLLDQNFRLSWTDLYKETLRTKVEFFYGPHYCLLSEKFRSAPFVNRRIGKVAEALVFFGGSDYTGETLKFLKLIPNYFKEINFQIVVGGANPFLESLKIEASFYSNVSLHIKTQDMVKLMLDTDIFIGAGGTVTWERCRMGLPAACLAVSSNQVKIAESLAITNIHEYLGESSKISDEEYLKKITAFIFAEDKRRLFSENSLKLEVGSKFDHLKNIFVLT